MGIGANKHVGSVVAVKVEFDIAGDVVLAIFRMRFDVKPGILSGGAVLGEMALDRIAERNGPEDGRCHVAGVGGAEDVFKVHKPARREVRLANLEGQRRLLLLLLPHSIGGWRRHTGRRVRAQGGIHDPRRATGGVGGHILLCCLLLQPVDFLLLPGDLLLLLGKSFAKGFQLIGNG